MGFARRTCWKLWLTHPKKREAPDLLRALEAWLADADELEPDHLRVLTAGLGSEAGLALVGLPELDAEGLGWIGCCCT